MYEKWLSEMKVDEKDTASWDKSFLDQLRKNVNMSVNGIR